MAKSDKKADKKAEKSKAAKPSTAPAKAKLIASSKEILAKAKTLKSNGKTPAKPVDDDSSDESSDSSSEDEKPKKTVVVSESDSDDSPEEKKPASTPAGKKGKGKMESSDSSSSDESSSDEDGDVKMQDVRPAKDKKAAAKSKAAKPAASPAKAKVPTSSKEILAKAEVPKASNGKVSESNDESSDSSSEDEPTKKAAPSSDSEESSDDEKPASAPALKGKGKVESKGSSDSSSSDDSSSDEEDTKVETVQPAKGTKRKAEAEPAAPPKKVKLDDDATADASTEETKSIFVGRLSWNVDNDWLAQEFADCGEVVSAHVQTDRATGKSRGFGYVHFASADAVEKALEMNGKEIDGRPVNIDKSTPPDKNAVRENRAKSFGDKSSPASSVLFVGNLSFGVNEDQLWEVFGEHGDVKSVRVPTDRESGRPKGFAYVEFSVLEAAKTAHEQLQGYELDGRNLRLDFSQPRDNAGGGGGRGGRGGFGDRGRGGFGDRGRGRGGFGGDRGRGGFGGDRGGRGRGRGGDRGGRGGGRGRGGPRTGAVTQFEGTKITFD